MLNELLLALALTSAGTGPQQPLADFALRVESYMTMRRAVQQQLTPLSINADRATITEEADALAQAIAKARQDARPGDIFSPEITTAVRAAIGRGCAQRFDDLYCAVIADLEQTRLPEPAVHGRWPAGAPLPTMPPDLLAALPPLPVELEYRFMDRALVLRDVEANLVIDYVADAIPQPPVLAPPRLLYGCAPPVPAMMVSGGEVLLEITVDLEGRVAGVRPLRSTPPLTDLVTAAVRQWRFEPAHRRFDVDTYTLRFSLIAPRMSTVLVAAVYRPPSLAAPTLGDAPADIATPMDETPRPLALIAPAFPLRAFAPGVVLLEVSVDPDGHVADARLVEPAPPFDAEALDAVRRWRFRPARIEGRPVPTLVYVMFGFPLPTLPE